MRAWASRITPWIAVVALTPACGSEVGRDDSNASGGVVGSAAGSAGASGAGASGTGGGAGAAGASGGGSAGGAGGSSTGGAGGGPAGAAGIASGGVSGTSGAGGSSGAPGGAGGAPHGGTAGVAGLGGASGASGGAGMSGGGAGGVAGGAGTGGTSGAGGGDALCAERTGGALIEAEVLGETLRFWTTNDAFIQEARASAGEIPERIPLLELADGRDCDAHWTFHFEPATPRFVDDWIDICDVELSRIEGDKTFYLANGDFCPRFMRIDRVSER